MGVCPRLRFSRWLMIEKVVDCIDELDQPHLKLMVMHYFMWALVEEQASNRACVHTEIETGIPDVISKLWTLRSMISPRTLLTRPFDPANQPTVCEYVRDQALTVNMLWEVAYGVCHEALHLDSLEDFNATEADLMDMKNNILAMWKSRDRRRTLSLRPTFTSSSVDSKEQGSTIGKTFTSGRAAMSISALHAVLVTAWVRHHCPSSSLWPHHPEFHLPSRLLSYIQELLPTSYPMVGTPMEI